MLSLPVWFDPLFATAFTAWGVAVTWLEIAAFAMAVGMVLLNMRVHPMAWPLAIGSSALYALLFARSHLWGEALLQGVFITLGAWGWWQWRRGVPAAEAAPAVRRLSGRWRAAALALTLAAWPLVAWLLQRHTQSDVPWWDAFTTTASIAGQVLLGRKFIENWPLWLVVNIVSVGLFAYKGLWLTTLLYALFAALSVAGWRAWRRLPAAA